jgi:hypothetical protein
LFSDNLSGMTLKFKTTNLASGIFYNTGSELKFSQLPVRGLYPVYAVKTMDFDHDGNLDILLGGNFAESKPEVGQYQAGFGTLLQVWKTAHSDMYQILRPDLRLKEISEILKKS